MRSDRELLRDFAERGSEMAFAELVQRHVDLVYSAALRQVGRDAHLAHDVAQMVFVALARKASALADRASLAGWLFTSTHYAAANTVRAERRRRTHEQESHMMHEARSESSVAIDWDRLRPVLDRAMLELNESDREIVVQRFFGGRSFVDIAAAMRMTEDTARKRAARALDKLHALLGRRGIRSTSSALALALSSHAVSAAPAGLAATLSAAALSGAALPAAAVAVIPFLTMSKLTIAIGAAAVALLGGSLVHQQRQASLTRAEVTALRNEHAKLTAETTDLHVQKNQRTAPIARSTTNAAGDDVAIPPSEITAKFGSLAQIRVGLDSAYAPLFRRLMLPPSHVETLKELLVQRKRAWFYVHDILAAEKMTAADLASGDRRQLERAATRDIDEQIRSLLGKADFAYYESFERTLQLRSMFTSLSTLLRSTPEPLRDEQVEQLISWTEAEFPSADRFEEHGVPAIWKQVFRGGGAPLSPLQFEKLAQYEKAMDSWQRIIAINRSAEAKGLIKASSHSRAP